MTVMPPLEDKKLLDDLLNKKLKSKVRLLKNAVYYHKF